MAFNGSNTDVVRGDESLASLIARLISEDVRYVRSWSIDGQQLSVFSKDN
jgi:hypothetical protein